VRSGHPFKTLPAPVQIRPGGPEDLDRLEPLWVSVRVDDALVGYGLERELRDQGVTDLAIGVLPGNDGALRLYERRGYKRTWMAPVALQRRLSLTPTAVANRSRLPASA
jgi:hypothetical protein